MHTRAERFEYRAVPVPEWVSDDLDPEPPSVVLDVLDRPAPDLLADLHVYAADGAEKLLV
jgi:hypothetical protein